MSQYFISGTGTGVGKTFAAAAMLHQARHYRAIKPVVSGYDGVAGSDVETLLLAMSKPVNEAEAKAISPFRFAAPLSPHLAAVRENRTIEPEKLLRFCREQMAAQSDLLIEGVGGLMVPITPQWLVLDWIQALDLPVILVAGSYLGAINHALLSIRMMEMSGLELRGVIISQSEECAGLDETASTIAVHLPKNAALISVPRISSWKQAPDLLSFFA